MQIELFLDGENKTFTTQVVPYLARRKYLELEVRLEEKIEKDKNYVPSIKEQLEEETEMIAILANVVFDGQFTEEQAQKGASTEYLMSKLRIAVFGEPKEGNEGNNQGK